MNRFTEYACEYLGGSNMVPIGILDNPEFKKEVNRLSGYTPPTEKEIISHNKRINVNIAKINKMVTLLLGPKGGKPKSGQALSDYKNLMYNLNILENSRW